ncbi:MAG TPA: alpha/beta fold hydrolase [Bryobacteraceae bacterium]|nr:alpha/beta fold hydrolase [Bryobacteraceae bacterium]
MRSLLLLFAICAAAGQDVQIPPDLFAVTLAVTDEASQPIPGAEVSLEEKVLGYTDSDGKYFLPRTDLVLGPHDLHFLGRHVFGLRILASGFAEGTATVAVSDSGDVLTKNLSLQLHHAPKGEPQPVRQRFGGNFGRFSGGQGITSQRRNNTNVIRVYYATDRASTGQPEASKYFSGDRSRPAALSRGYCDVSIPIDHQLGSLEGPSMLRLDFYPDPERHIIASNPVPLERLAYYQAISQSLQKFPGAELLVFIHGYNVGFESAVRRTAQIAYDLHLPIIPVAYSWPSQNRTLAYLADEDTAEWSAYHLRDFLDELSANTGGAKIHVVAHSMGARVLTSALKEIAAAERGHEAGGIRFGQIVLAAPDLSSDTLVEFAKRATGLSSRFTVYASEKDDALILSHVLHSSWRAGQVAGLVTPGVDTIDATSVSTDLIGHNYFGANNSIISDAKKLIEFGWPPPQRNLVPVITAAFTYWVIPAPK